MCVFVCVCGVCVSLLTFTLCIPCNQLSWPRLGRAYVRDTFARSHCTYICAYVCEMPLIIYFTLAYVTYPHTHTHACTRGTHIRTRADSKTGGNFNVQQKRVTFSIVVVVDVAAVVVFVIVAALIVVAFAAAGAIVRGYCVHRIAFT